MKIFLSILFLFALHAQATTYYFSMTDGNDGRTAVQAQSSATPWKTIAKLNAIQSTLVAGDFILFKRGDTWVGETIIPAKSGTTGNVITYGAYGSGARPVVSGFTPIVNWTSLGGNIYESNAAVTSLPNVYMLTVDGNSYSMGRYPNPDAANKGWLKKDATPYPKGDSVFYDLALPSSPTNWTGAQIVTLTATNYLNDTATILSHTADSGSYKIKVDGAKILYNFVGGYGYFIQNDARTLDQHGEWFLNKSSKLLKIYLSSAPAGHTIKVGTIDSLLSLADDAYLTFDNIRFEGSNMDNIILGNGCNHITIQNCDIINAGNRGIFSQGNSIPTTNTFTVTNCNIWDCGNYGVDVRGMGNNFTFTYNQVKRIALHIGMAGADGGKSAQTKMGVSINSGKNHAMSYNVLDSLGYNGIRFGNIDSVNVENNVITHFGLGVDDVGGIYSYGGKDSVNVTRTFGRVIRGNIIGFGYGIKEGTTVSYGAVSGIYLDDNCTGTDLIGNTVFDCDRTGIYVHNSPYTTLLGNTMYNNGSTAQRYGLQIMHDRAPSRTIHHMVSKNNIIIAKKSNQVVYYPTNTQTTGGTLNAMAAPGDMDSNYIFRPINNTTVIRRQNQGAAVGNITLAAYKAAYPHEVHSPTASPVTFSDVDSTDYYIRFVYNPNNYDSTVTLAGNYITPDGISYTAGSLVIPAFSSKVLLRTPGVPNIPDPIRKIMKMGNKVMKMGNKVMKI